MAKYNIGNIRQSAQLEQDQSLLTIHQQRVGMWLIASNRAGHRSLAI
jgi:hypothetical protein